MPLLHTRFPPRPRYMRRKTYLRLCETALRLEAEIGAPRRIAPVIAADTGAPVCYTQSKRQVRVQRGSVTFNPSLTEPFAHRGGAPCCSRWSEMLGLQKGREREGLDQAEVAATAAGARKRSVARLVAVRFRGGGLITFETSGKNSEREIVPVKSAHLTNYSRRGHWLVLHSMAMFCHACTYSFQLFQCMGSRCL